MVERSDEKRLELDVGILFSNPIDQWSGGLGFVRIEFEEPVVTSLKPLADFLGLGRGIGDEFTQATVIEILGKLGQPNRKHRGQRGRAMRIFLKRIKPLVIPAGVNLFSAAFLKRHMNVDRGSLTDSVEPSDALFEEFGIRRQIEKHEMMGELEIPAFATDLRANQKAGAVLLREVGGVAVAL